AGQVLAHLQTIPALAAAGNVTVTGPVGGPFAIAFGGTLTQTDVNAITTTVAGGATAPIATATNGSNADNSDVVNFTATNQTISMANHPSNVQISNPTLNVTGNDDLTISAKIDAAGTSGSLTVGGSGRVALTNSGNAFTGTGAGVVTVNGSNAILTLRNAAAA